MGGGGVVFDCRHYFTQFLVSKAVSRFRTRRGTFAMAMGWSWSAAIAQAQIYMEPVSWLIDGLLVGAKVLQ